MATGTLRLLLPVFVSPVMTVVTVAVRVWGCPAGVVGVHKKVRGGADGQVHSRGWVFAPSVLTQPERLVTVCGGPTVPPVASTSVTLKVSVKWPSFLTVTVTFWPAPTGAGTTAGGAMAVTFTS
jgi:hypothetical protein